LSAACGTSPAVRHYSSASEMTAFAVLESFDHPSHHLMRFSEADVLSFPNHERCPACDAESRARVLVELGGENWKERLRLVQCEACETLYYQNPPDDAFLADYYSRTWKQGDGETLVQLTAPRRVKSKTVMAKILSDYGITDTGTKILDIGCGLGHLLNGLHDAGFTNLWGVEMSPYRVAVVRQRFGDRIFSGGYEGVPDEMRFDVIYANHVFEHIRHCGKAFAWMIEHLSERGIIILVVPNSWHEPVVNQVMFLPHLHSFAAKSFAVMAEKHGLTPKFWRNGAAYDLACVFVQPGSPAPRTSAAFGDLTQFAGPAGSQRDRIRAPWAENKSATKALAMTKVYLSEDSRIRTSGYAALSRGKWLAAKACLGVAAMLCKAGFASLGRKIGRHGAHLTVQTQSATDGPIIICDQEHRGLFSLK